MKCTSFCALTAMALALCGGIAKAATFAPDAAKAASRLTTEQRDERSFIRAAAARSRFEADASKLALARSSNPGVRALAADLINHYNATGIEMQHLLHGRGMAMPMLDNEYRKVLNRLGKLSGSKFDRDYMEQVGLKYQREDIRQYEKASLTATDPALKAWVDRQLPTLRYQLMQAERVATPAGKTALPGKATRPVTVVLPGTLPPVVAPRSTVARGGLATQSADAGLAAAGANRPISADFSGSSSR